MAGTLSSTALGIVPIPSLVDLPVEDRDDLSHQSIQAQAALNRNFNTIAQKINAQNVERDRAWTQFTPSWNATTTNPVIGNGTQIGFYKKIGKVAYVRVLIAPGSTTTFGTGNYLVYLPAEITPVAGYEQNIICKIWVPGSNYFGFAYFNSTAMNPNFGSPASAWTPTSPGTFANGGNFHINGAFECQ